MPSLDDAYASEVDKIRARVSRYVGASFRSGSMGDQAAEDFIRRAVPVIIAGRRQVSALTDAYMASVISDLLGKRVGPVGAIGSDSLRGTADAEVYARPFVTARAKLAQGAPFDVAVEAGAQRLNDILLTDMQLAKTHTARNAMSGKGFPGYVRVLKGKKDCGLCVVASTMRYNVSDLLPIHPGCNCGVRPLVAGDRARMGDTLGSAHDAVADRFGESAADARQIDYRKIVLVQEHGEIGPVLTVKSHSFTGPADMKAQPKPNIGFASLSAYQVEHQLAILEKLKPTSWRDLQIDRYRARLAELGN